MKRLSGVSYSMHDCKTKKHDEDGKSATKDMYAHMISILFIFSHLSL